MTPCTGCNIAPKPCSQCGFCLHHEHLRTDHYYGPEYERSTFRCPEGGKQ